MIWLKFVVQRVGLAICCIVAKFTTRIVVFYRPLEGRSIGDLFVESRKKRVTSQQIALFNRWIIVIVLDTTGPVALLFCRSFC